MSIPFHVMKEMRTVEQFNQHADSLLVTYDPTVGMYTYSFRASYLTDMVKFLNQVVLKARFFTSLFVQTDPRLQEPVVQFQSSANLEDLRNILREMEDSHVMLETLRQVPLSQNNCERDNTIR